MTATPTPNSAVTVGTVTQDDLTEMLRDAGLIDQASEKRNRLKLDGSTIWADDESYVYNIKKGDAAFSIQIIAPPEEYQSKFFDADTAALANRPEIEGRFCKSFYGVEGQDRRFSETGASCDACAWSPWVKQTPDGGSKCGWRGDLLVKILPDEGDMTGDEQEWTLTLPMTSMIEYRGTRREPAKGSVSDLNFMFKLTMLAKSMASEWGVDERTAVVIGLTAYQAGGVVAEVRLPRGQNAKGDRSWTVISLTPTYIAREFADAAPDETVYQEATIEQVMDGTAPV